MFSSQYGVQQLPRRQQILSDQTSVLQTPQITIPLPQITIPQLNMPQRIIVSPQQLLLDQQQQLQQKIQESTIVTEAGQIWYFIKKKIYFFFFLLDNLCRGQQPETVIPIGNGHKFVVCLTDGKGFEQHCPRTLVFQPQTRRCERSMFRFFFFIFCVKIFIFLRRIGSNRKPMCLTTMS